MQRGREVREESINSGGPFDSFGSFGGLGPQRSMMSSSIFGGGDPFDDPFFTRPFDSIFGPSMFSSGTPFSDSPHISSSSKGPIIEELHSDDEEEEKVNDVGAKGKDKAKKSTGSNQHPHVEHPEDQADERKSKDVSCGSNFSKVEGMKPPARSVSFQKVTYGGINGAYYTASTTRRTGDDGVVLEESKQADKTSGQAAHRISRGIHDKGHSLTRKLSSDGKVDTLQALHNLNEDELAGFEQAWKGNEERLLPGWDDSFNFNGAAGASNSSQRGWASGSSLALPFERFSGRSGGTGAYNEAKATSSGARTKKVIRINIE